MSLAVLGGATVFARDADDMTDAGVAQINRLIDDLHAYDSIVSIRIVGHTDSRGPAAYNEDLSRRRAEHIAAYFRTRLPGVRVVSLGLGESQPMASNETAEGRSRNRRVDIQIIATGTPGG